VDILEWFGNARHLAFRYNMDGQYGFGAHLSCCGFRPTLKTNLLNVYSVVK
jgi:hypothetical protein